MKFIVSKLSKNIVQTEEEILAEYDEWWKHLSFIKRDKKRLKQDAKCYREVLSNLKIEQGKKILDVACGWGELLVEAKKMGLITAGIDISKEAIRLTKKKMGDGNFIVGRAEKLPFKNNSFDYVVCNGSLEHFLDKELAIKEITRVLKPRGKVFIRVPNLYFLGHIYITVRYGVFPSEGGQDFSESFSTVLGWKDLLQENGLSVIEVKKYNTIFATQKVNKAIIFAWNLCKDLIPTGLSYCFDYICTKK